MCYSWIGRWNYVWPILREQVKENIGKKIAMHIAASNPLAIDKGDINKDIVEKELEIIKAEIINSGKPKEMVEKISKGKINQGVATLTSEEAKTFSITHHHTHEK